VCLPKLFIVFFTADSLPQIHFIEDYTIFTIVAAMSMKIHVKISIQPDQSDEVEKNIFGVNLPNALFSPTQHDGRR